MQKRVKFGWVLGGVAAIGLMGWTPPRAQAQRDRRADTEYHEDEDRPVEVRELPREVRRQLDDMRGDHPIVSIQYVKTPDRAFYRCIVQARSGERNIRLGTDGRVIGDAFISNHELEAWHDKDGDRGFFKDWERRQWEEDHYWNRLAARVTATVKNPERVDVDKLPPPRVRATFFQEAAGEPVTFVVRYRQGPDVIYQTNVPDGPNRTRVIQCTTDGHLYAEATVGGGHSDLAVHTIDYSDLPWPVRKTVNKETEGAYVRHVDVADRLNHRVYNVVVDDGHYSRYLTLSEDGRILSDASDRR